VRGIDRLDDSFPGRSVSLFPPQLAAFLLGIFLYLIYPLLLFSIPCIFIPTLYLSPSISYCTSKPVLARFVTDQQVLTTLAPAPLPAAPK
jgi:hypothetical protein